MTLTITERQVKAIVWRWASAQREACNPNTSPLYGMPKPKTQKQREAERLVAIATRNMVHDILGIDPLYTLAIHLGFDGGLAPNEEIVAFINQKGAAQILTDLFLNQLTIESEA